MAGRKRSVIRTPEKPEADRCPDGCGCPTAVKTGRIGPYGMRTSGFTVRPAATSMTRPILFRQPHRETGLKGIRLQGGQNTSEDIFLRNAMRKVQQLQQDLGLHIGPLGDGRWSVGSGQHCHDRNDDHTVERMQQVHRRSRIFQLFEMPQDFLHTHPHTTGHRSSSMFDTEPKPTDDGLLQHRRKRKSSYIAKTTQSAARALPPPPPSPASPRSSWQSPPTAHGPAQQDHEPPEPDRPQI